MKILLCTSLLLLALASPLAAETALQPHAVLDAHGDALSPSAGFDMMLNAGFAPDGRTVYFTEAKRDWSRLALFQADVAGDRWSNVTPLSFSDPRYRDTDPAVSAEGTMIVFASDRPLPGQNYDPNAFAYHLWTVRKTADGWSGAHPLDDPANTLAPVLYPALDNNGTLYFMRITKDVALIYRSAPTPQLLNFPGVKSALDGSVSPDGGRLAFVAAVTIDGKPRTRLFLASRTGDAWNASPFAIDGLVSGPAATAFSRDGKRIYFAGSMNNGDAPAKPGIFYIDVPA